MNKTEKSNKSQEQNSRPYPYRNVKLRRQIEKAIKELEKIKDRPLPERLRNL